MICDNCNGEFIRTYRKNVYKQHEHNYCNACYNTKRETKESDILLPCIICNSTIKRKYLYYSGKNNYFFYCSRDCSNKGAKSGGYKYKQTSETNTKLYGGIGYASDLLNEKSKRTTQVRYGHEHFSQTDTWNDVFSSTCRARYDSDNVFQVDFVKQKSKNTCMKRYGTEYAIQSDIVKNKIDYKDIAIKSHQTKKKRSRYNKSSILEDKIYNLLITSFNETDVERYASVNNWSIDFYIKSINTYIQLDGTYWHGLDRPLEQIMLFEHKRDKIIYSTYLRDLQQNEWFSSNNKKLIRILDTDVYKTSINILDIINEKLVILNKKLSKSIIITMESDK